MKEPLARASVITYRDSEALDWRFDRRDFTVTQLMQSPDEGGSFQYRSDLCSDTYSNLDGVLRVLPGAHPKGQGLPLPLRVLNVFKAKNTAPECRLWSWGAW